MFTLRKKSFITFLVLLEYFLLLVGAWFVKYGVYGFLSICLLGILATFRLFNIFDLERESTGLVGIGQHKLKEPNERLLVYRIWIFIFLIVFPLVFVFSMIRPYILTATG